MWQFVSDSATDGPCYYCGVRFWRPLWIACTELMQREGANRIRAMIPSDDVSGDDSIDDATECDGDNVERRGD